MKIAVAMTTAPREKPTFAESYQSVRDAGFEDVFVFSDGWNVGGDERITVRPATIAPPRFEVEGPFYGAFRNWVQSLDDLLTAEPDADAVLMLQDDVRMCKGVREFLEDGAWRLQDVGIVTLCTSWAYRGICRERGLNRIDLNRTVIAGAWTLLIPRDVAEAALDHELSQQKTGWHWRFGADPARAKSIDTYIGTVMIDLQKAVYGYRPSLAEHIGETSTIHGTARLTGNRATLSFAGVDADASEVMRGPR